jgi:hypothetical protein
MNLLTGWWWHWRFVTQFEVSCQGVTPFWYCFFESYWWPNPQNNHNYSLNTVWVNVGVEPSHSASWRTHRWTHFECHEVVCRHCGSTPESLSAPDLRSDCLKSQSESVERRQLFTLCLILLWIIDSRVKGMCSNNVVLVFPTHCDFIPPVNYLYQWLILCFAGINPHTGFRYGYVFYFLVVSPLVSMGESDESFVLPGLMYIPAFGMVFYLEKKQRHIFWFLSFSSRADIKQREWGEDSRR